MFFSACLGGIAARLPSLPPPAPLVPLPAAFSRRAALVGVAVSTGVLAGSAARAVADIGRPMTADAAVDALSALYAEVRALRAAAEHATSDAEVDRLTARLTELERAAMAAVITTPAGAIAALEWVRADLLRDDGGATDFDFHPALIGQAIEILQRLGGVS